jgi:23S rRNA pseudouridine1911/1915/1917 synthase
MTLLARLEALHPGASRRSVKQWLAGGRVRVNGEVVRRGDAPVAADDRVTLGPPPPPTLPGRLRIVHEDPRVVVVDKPAGLLTIATERERQRTAYRLLRDHLAARARPGDRRQPLFIVHRLDRETSGLLVFARTPAVKQLLQAQFAARTVERDYVAVVEGRVRDDAGTLRMRLVEDEARRVRVAHGTAGRDAITHYRVVARGADATRLALRLETGRRGQIRAQLAAIGHPIVGDAAYGSRRDPLRRVCLHATRLGFTDESGRLVSFDSPPPAAFLTLTAPA